MIFYQKAFPLALGAVLLIAGVNYFLISPPGDFPEGRIVSLEQGMSLRAVSAKLKEENFIRSRVAFEAFVIIYAGERHAVAADYYFEKKLPAFEVARRVAFGKSALAPIRFTIPEGFTNQEIAASAARLLPNFVPEIFLKDASDKEGYLFPDTYFFIFRASSEDVLGALEKNYEKKIVPLRPEIAESGKSEDSIITMASLIEREAKGLERAVISGILWKRLALGRALEVDAAPDTYQKRGLPEAPIANPGLASIKAAIHPENSPYLYYLHDSEGNIHYARTFEEHKKNKALYLK
ncbi:MAG: endolytic transglycosylase MltG [Patescibacteria group bacterium]